MIGPGDTCKVINNEDYPFKIGWGNIEYLLPPHEERFVPAEAVINYFGDPRSVADMKHIEESNGQHTWIADRPTEVRRLRIKWARYNMNNGEEELVAPKVDVFTLDGRPVPTVTSDPAGVNVMPQITTQADQFDRDAVIMRMQAQLDALLKERNIQQMVEPVTVESEIPVDSTPQSSATKKPVTAKAANDE
jgi:hypothetical protein